jgi:hypothetical protein
VLNLWGFAPDNETVSVDSRAAAPQHPPHGGDKSPPHRSFANIQDKSTFFLQERAAAGVSGGNILESEALEVNKDEVVCQCC